jgi:hypothetical protein
VPIAWKSLKQNYNGCRRIAGALDVTDVPELVLLGKREYLGKYDNLNFKEISDNRERTS